MQGLRQDRYERKTEGYLPSAHIVFLDEIWKAGPAIQNTLLTVINEKVYRNGAQEQDLPLELLIAASNELPAPGMGLEALWDRFLVRLYVDNIQSEENLRHLMRSSADPYGDPFTALDEEQQDLRLSLTELAEWRKQCAQVDLPPNIESILLQLKKRLELYNEEQLQKAELQTKEEAAEEKGEEQDAAQHFYLSDRRLLKIVGLLKANALLHGRKEVNQTDLILLPYCLWGSHEQMQQARNLVAEVLEQYAFSAGDFAKQLKSLDKGIDEHLAEVAKERAKGEVNHKLQKNFDKDKEDLSTQLQQKRAELSAQKQQQLGQPLFASPKLLEPLEKGFRSVQAQLDVLEQTLKSGQAPQQVAAKKAHPKVLGAAKPPTSSN